MKKTLLLLLFLISLSCLTACGEDHFHAYGVWSYDGETHWQQCDSCDKRIKKGSHKFAADECTVCGYIKGDEKPHLEFKPEGDAYVVKGIGTVTAPQVDIPATYRNKPVVAVDESAFSGNERITSVVFPDCVTEIRKSAFFGCVNLSSVTLGANVESIENEAFGGCEKIVRIELPQALRRLVGAFRDCKGLTDIVIPNGMTEIGRSAFSGCENLRTVEFPDSLTEIGRSAFSGCENLRTVEFPDSLTEIGAAAFYGCVKLKNITIPSAEYIRAGAFGGCTSLQAADAKPEVIENGAFAGCSNLSGMDLSEATSIGDGAFEGCAALEFESSGAETIGRSAFKGCISLSDVTLANAKRIDDEVFANCENLASIMLSDDIEYLGDDIFAGCDMLGYNALDGADYLGSAKNPHLALFDCDKRISALTVAGTCKYICSRALAGCAVSSVTVQSGVKTIGKEAFEGCAELTDLSLPESLCSMGTDALEGCDRLKYYTFDSAYYLGNARNNHVVLVKVADLGITSCKISEDCKVIYCRAFAGKTDTQKGCEKLKEIVIPDGVKEIGEKAFFWCCGAERIQIGQSVERIGKEAFRMCYLAARLTVPDSVKEVGEGAFSRWYALTSVHIGSGLTAISERMFEECDAFETIAVPDGVTYIFGNAFNGCRSLKCIVMGKGISGWESDALGSCKNIYFTGQESEAPDFPRGFDVFYYSETPQEGNYWHYEGGKPVAWEQSAKA